MLWVSSSRLALSTGDPRRSQARIPALASGQAGLSQIGADRLDHESCEIDAGVGAVQMLLVRMQAQVEFRFQKIVHRSHYSARSAVAGSTLHARRAGR